MAGAGSVSETPGETTNGAGLASFLAAGIGAFAMGAFAVANEAGVLVAPSLYAPAGGVSGRTTFAAAVWLVAWAVLHSRWKGREIQPRVVFVVTISLNGLGLLGTFPPVWSLF